MSVSALKYSRPLQAVLGGLIDVPDQLQVTDITLDSRAVSAGAAFLACRGHQHHGLDFVQEAASRGARAVLWEPAPGVSPPQLDDSIVVRAVPNLSQQIGFIADRFFDAPSASVTIAGITGTNGKTTCAWLLSQALSLCGRRAAYMGTLGYGVAAALQPLAHTTPDAVTVHRLLARLRAAGFDSIAMEVSSHALDQQRVAAVRFHTAVFTNLTRDHLDYHGDMDSYAAAKARLLNWITLRARVINIDDPFGSQWLSQHDGARTQGRLFLVSRRSLHEPVPGAEHVIAERVHSCPDGLELQLQTSRGPVRLASRLIGDFNAANLMTVLAVLLAWDVPLGEARDALEQCSAPPGRMQIEGGGTLPLVLIDYAHTPDALAKALQAARAHCRGRLWCVFGCGGERDSGKRAQMGQVAASGADEQIITDDNPRREDPRQIVAQIMQGAGAQARVIHDRAQAIQTAIALADTLDVVLVAGKGHEDYQIIETQRRPFSDALVARAALARRSGA